MKIFYLALVMILMCVSEKKIYAQSFSKTHHSPVQTCNVILDNYTSLVLKAYNKSLSNINHFDPGNPYTFIQTIQDENDKTYQILYQTDFGGNVLFLAYSNNLEDIFNRTEKPLFRFLSCIGNVNASDFSTENIEKSVNCIVERLNYCRE